MLQRVLGEVLAGQCLDEILERQHPEDSPALCKALRMEIISKYISKAGLDFTAVESRFSDDDKEKYEYIFTDVKDRQRELKRIGERFMRESLPHALYSDMTPEGLTDRTKFTDAYNRTASKSEK